MKRIGRFSLAVFYLWTGGFLVTLQAQDPAPISTKYDSVKNRSEIEFSQMEIPAVGGQKIYFGMTHMFAGQQNTIRPDIVLFIVSVASPGGYKHPEVMRTKIVLDGKQENEIEMLNLDKRPLDQKLFLETIGTRLSYNLLVKMAVSKKVEMRLDQTQVSFESTHIAKIAAFLKAITP